MAPDETGQTVEPLAQTVAKTGIAAPGESPDRTPKGFEEMVVIRLAAIPRNQSIHRTLQTLASTGIQNGMSVDDLKHFFLTNQPVFEQFTEDLGDVMQARLTIPRAVPEKLPKAVIDRAIHGMIDYFMHHVEEGSLYDHIGRMERDWPEESLEDFRTLLASEKFQSVIIQAFRSFIGIILDHIFVASGIQAAVHRDVAHELRQRGGSGDGVEMTNATPPFDLLSRFMEIGTEDASRRIYVEACLRGYSEQRLNELFYWSDDGRPHRAPTSRKSAEAARESEL